jgi:hypothetical protein
LASPHTGEFSAPCPETALLLPIAELGYGGSESFKYRCLTVRTDSQVSVAAKIEAFWTTATPSFTIHG